MQNHHPFENADLQDAMSAQCGQPEILPELPVGFCEVLLFESFPFFQDEDGVAFLCQSHRGDTAPEAASNDYIIIDLLHSCYPPRYVAVIITIAASKY
jgi:hypothetical protein